MRCSRGFQCSGCQADVLATPGSVGFCIALPFSGEWAAETGKEESAPAPVEQEGVRAAGRNRL